MAKVKLGPVAGQISGSIGGTVFAHNRGGAYIRIRSMVDKHTSVKAYSAKGALAFISGAWSRLSDPNRSAWTEWARQNPTTDTLGESRPLDGHQAYVGLNSRVIRLGGTPSNTPPTIMAPPPLKTLSLASVHAAATTMVFTPAPSDASTSLWVLACLVNSGGIDNIKNALSLMHIYSGAVTSPKVITTEFVALCGAVKVGQHAHIWVSVVDSTTGLSSQPMRADALVS